MFASVAAPAASPMPILEAAFWIWIHLLQFDVSNQSLKPEEDIHNKPDRPLPSGRISLGQARLLRWLLIPACIGFSAMYSKSVAAASAGLVMMTIIYDEMGAHAGHWILRNTVNALGFGCFEVGSTLVAGEDTMHLTSHRSANARQCR
jgi:4-hydroxybenzoate polyprenyltransferase